MCFYVLLTNTELNHVSENGAITVPSIAITTSSQKKAAEVHLYSKKQNVA